MSNTDKSSVAVGHPGLAVDVGSDSYTDAIAAFDSEFFIHGPMRTLAMSAMAGAVSSYAAMRQSQSSLEMAEHAARSAATLAQCFTPNTEIRNAPSGAQQTLR